MLISGISVARLCLRVTWVLAIVTLVLLAAMPTVIAHLDRELFIVRGGSMEPAVPYGSAVIVRHFAEGAPQVGEIISFRLSNGTVVTHRVMAVNAENGLTFQTKGDANPSVDPVAVPASAVIGTIEHTLPYVGLVLGAMSSSIGAAAAAGLVCGLLFAVWFMDELLVIARRSSGPSRVTTEPAR